MITIEIFLVDRTLCLISLMASKKSSATKIECNICVKNVSKTVKCPFCDFETCRECSIKYVLDVIQPKCMNCSKVWTRHVLFDLFGKSFVATKYKNKRQNDLFETEKALLPDTLLVLNEEQNRTASEMVDEFISKWFVLKSIGLTEDSRENVIATVLKEITDCFVERFNLPNPGIQQREETRPKEKVKVHAVQQIKCPYEDCRGFVRMDNMTCGLCGTKVCGQCREIVFFDKKHDCDPNTVETINLLKKDTKPCPKCSVSIHKIEGCDQMFCVECRTAFSWKTLEIVTGTIHNPHYFDYLRTRGRGEIPRQIGDVACGGFPDAAELVRIFENRVNKYGERSNLQTELLSLNRMGIHTEAVELPKYLTTILDNVDLRRSYLRGTITEAVFKQKIQEKNKHTDKRAEIHETLSTFAIAGGDIFRNLAGKCEDIVGEPKSHRNRNLATLYCEEALVELRELVEFVNSSLTKIGDIFNNVVPILSHDSYARDGIEWIWTKYNPGLKKVASRR